MPTRWLEEASLPRWSPVARRERCEVLVIGAGLAGLATARELRARGRDVLVVDRAGPAEGASGRNAGFVLLTHAFSFPALARTLGPEATHALLGLSRANRRAIAERFAQPAQLRLGGALMLAMEGDAAELETLRESAALLAAEGERTRFVDVPAGLSGYAAALELGGDGELHPGRLSAALAAGLRGGIANIERIDAGARVAHCAPITPSGDSATIAFERCVIATNAWARELVPTAEITPARAQVVLTAPLAPVLGQPCYAGWGYDYFRQRSDGRVLLGGRRHLFVDAEATDVAEPSDEVQRALEAYLRTHLAFARDAPIERRWAGIMGFSSDGLPLVGPLPSAPEALSIIAGFTGHGLGLALACAALLADALCGTSAMAEHARAAQLLSPARSTH